jgi:hypothetical protein
VFVAAQIPERNSAPRKPLVPSWDNPSFNDVVSNNHAVRSHIGLSGRTATNDTYKTLADSSLHREQQNPLFPGKTTAQSLLSDMSPVRAHPGTIQSAREPFTGL